MKWLYHCHYWMDLIQACIEEDDAVREYQNKDKILKSHYEKPFNLSAQSWKIDPRPYQSIGKGFIAAIRKSTLTMSKII